jgi:ATP-dependent DNA ligase
VLGVYDAAGRPWTLGMTHPLGAAAASVLTPLLEAAQPAGRLLPSRFQELQVEWLRLPELLVAEVSCTHLDGGRRLRQPAKFVRWRPDREPANCRLGQEADDLLPKS